MTRASESELTLVSRAPFQHRPVSRFPSWLKANIGRFSLRAARAASRRLSAQGILRQLFVSLSRMARTRLATQSSLRSAAGASGARASNSKTSANLIIPPPCGDWISHQVTGGVYHLADRLYQSKGHDLGIDCAGCAIRACREECEELYSPDPSPT